MTNARRSWIQGCLWLWACGLVTLPARAQLVDEPPPTTAGFVDVQPRVERAFEQQDRVGVFVILRGSDGTARQETLVGALGSNFELRRRYQNIPVVAGELSRAGLAMLRQHADVVSVQLDGAGSGGLAEALPAVGVDKVQSVRGLSGKGVTVAVLDSGASTTHPALKGAIVGQHCFTQGGCAPGFAREGESAEDDHNHGSNVSGIVASRGGGTVSKGCAPAGSLVSVKVLDRNNAGQVSDWVAGFDWVFSNLSKFNIKVINASLCSTAEYATATACDGSETALAMITKKLVDAGVTITSSSGNTGHTATMTAPACNTGVIAVGATYDSNLGKQPEQGSTYRALGGPNWPACSDMTTNAKTIACFTSTAGARLDLLAPGTQINSAGVGTGRSLFRGTSQAAPGVAGLAALLLECNPALTPSTILSTLKMTGERVMDPRSGMSYPLIRGVEAADAACGGMTGMAGAGGGMTGVSGSGGAVAGAAGPAAGSGAGGAGTALGGRDGAAGFAAIGGGVAGVVGTAGIAAPGRGTPTSDVGTSPAPGASAPPATGVRTAGGQAVSAAAGAVAVVPRNLPQDSGCSCSTPGSRSEKSSSALLFSALAVIWFARRRRLPGARQR